MVNLAELMELKKEEEKKYSGRYLEPGRDKFAELILRDEPDSGIPDDLKNKFWAVFDKEQSLSNLTDKDVDWLMRRVDIALLRYKMSRPHYALSYDDAFTLSQIKQKAYAKIKRSTGGMQRERGLWVTEAKEFRMNEATQPRGGFFSKIAGMFRGRR